MGKPLHWIIILQLLSIFAYRYGSWHCADAQRPVDVIADVVNDLGMKILQQYSTHGNVAFSPMGIAFVLAALYEGSAGRGSQQIVIAMGLPTNRDITRIGFRDIHRRLRTYLNADGFLGGLTLSKENTRLRPEYEDILRFYGFDLSGIEQETNITVSAGNTSSTTEPPTFTAGATLTPMEINTVSNTTTLTDTTTLTNLITALFPSNAGTTISPSTAAGAMQRPVTMPIGADGQPIIPTANTTAVPENIPTPATNSLATPVNSLTTSGESTQLPSSAGAESTASLPNTSTEVAPTSMDSQTSSSTVTMVVSANNQNMQIPATAANTSDTGINGTTTNTTAPNTGIVTGLNIGNMNSNGSIVPNTNNQATVDTGTTMIVTINSNATTSMGANTEVSSIPNVNTGISTATNATTPNSSITADAGSEMLALANSMIVNMLPINMSVSNAALDPLTPMVAANSNIANVTTISNAEMMMDNSIISESSNGTLMPINTSAESISEMNSMIGSVTVSMTNVDDTITISSEDTTSVSSTEIDMVLSNSTITNSTMIAVLTSNQTAATFVDENTILMNRKRKTIDVEITESGLDLLRNIASGNTINDKSTDRTSSFHKRRARSPRGYFSSYPDEGVWMQNLDIWKSYSMVNPSETPVEDSASTSEISFLVNGCDTSSVSASRYIAILPFAYFPSLNAVAIEFPLDDPRYNIMLLMPTDRTDTHRLVRNLEGKSLRSLRKQLQPTWVRATIPSFMLRGFVTLTSFLQRLGILDVFEPRVADLSPMTTDLGIYARDIQQSIGVNIRNYLKPDRTHSRESSNVESLSVVPPRRDSYRYLPPGNGLFERAGPVPFTALHPFLYFIIDTETSVSLIAGRIDDPLNSRIL